MRVVRIVSELDFGGVEQVLMNSIPALVQNEGLDLTILVLGKGGKIADQLISQGISVQILGLNPRIPNVSLILSVSKILFRVRPDVVHAQGSEANFHGILGAKLIGVPRIIGEEIGIPHHHSYWKWIFRYVYRQAHQVIAISDAVKKAIVELGEVPLEKVSVIYNPVSSVQGSGFKVQRSANSDFIFVTTCRLVPIKNLERLIESFARLVKANPDRELGLKIVGDGPERKSLELLIQNLELSGQVELLGFQSDVWPFLQASDAFVLPSLQEGSSVSLAEAMSAGLPSIVTQVGGASEILGDSHSGILIDPLDAHSIQSAMQEVLDLSPEERQVLGERAKKEADRFSVENYIKEFITIYKGSDPNSSSL
jgi:glycosyltransferase involved in cell wall biosynthesis